ncbi:MAG: ABC transporter ATP-binding protein [Alphaproteobacteria bacterium]|nr:ABC transporter ATP-binding protein [Alphaproteobacteria bacterium]
MDAPRGPRSLAVVPAVGIRVVGATLTYRGDIVFRDLAVDFDPGLTSCLLGPSGVGKSSLLRMIAGLAPSGGRVMGSDGGPLAGRIAYMDQRDLLLPWLRVIDNVTLGSRLRGTRADRPAARALLERVGLQGNAADYPRTLSGGMRQRVALARTLMEDRPVVLMDEPFSALDALTRLRLQDLSAELLAGRTVVMVTHDPFEALRLADRIYVLSGRPAELGEALLIPNYPPRDPTAGGLAALHHELLDRLKAADAGSEPERRPAARRHAAGAP